MTSKAKSTTHVYKFTTPYTGLSSNIPGIRSETANAMFSYLNPDDRIEILSFRISQRLGIISTLRSKHDICAAEKQIEAWQAQIDDLKNPVTRKSEAARLLAHRAGYIDRLTDEDRAMIEAENQKLMKDMV